MCLAIVACDAHPRYRLVVAANRDEYHSREASPAAWWPEGILAGRDSVAGGTWFGVTRAGRWALVTNFREAIARDPAAPSRGALVTNALCDAAPPLLTAARVASDGSRFHGFNLLVGDRNGVACVSNRASGAMVLASGLHGLSNHLLETPWPKLVRAKSALEQWLDDDDADIARVFNLLADRVQAAADTLPMTGVSPERERVLSSVFIVTPEYGTRCSTVLTIAHDGAAEFVERSFDATGRTTDEVAYAFSAEADVSDH